MTDTASIIALAAVYGFTMKIADLLNEHGLKWFWGDALLFGLIWGTLGALLVVGDAAVANVILAMIIAYITRMRLDYFNHALAASLIIIAFLLAGVELDVKLFFTFFVVFVAFGSLRDYTGNARGKRDWWFHINEPGWYYYIPPFIWSVATGMWLVFWVLAVYRTCYNIAKYGLYRAGIYSKL